MPRSRVTPGAVLRYRVMAYVTGVMLLGLCFSIYLQFGPAQDSTPVEIFGTAHGYLYLLYLIAATDLAWRARWSLLKTVLVLLAGTIPFMSFVAEHFVVRDLRARPTATAPPATETDSSSRPA
jgi:integral membrane protein